jgi:hypothetical protein
MKTDENVEEARTLVRTDRHLGIRMIRSGGVEYVQRNCEANLTTDLNIKHCVPKWSQRIRYFLAGKHIPTLRHAPY